MINRIISVFALFAFISMVTIAYAGNGNTTEAMHSGVAVSAGHYSGFAGGCIPPSLSFVQGNPSSICPGDTAVLELQSATLNDATAWYLYSGSCGGSLIATTTDTFFKVTPATNTTYYIRGEGGCVTPGTCQSVSVTLLPSPAVTDQPNNSNLCTGGGTLFVIAATGPAPLTYQWQVSTGGAFTDITNGGNYTGANDDTLIVTGITPALQGNQYRCVVNGGGSCDADTSNSASLTVLLPPSINSESGDSTVCEGDGVGFSITASGQAPLFYQWQQNSGSGWVNLNNGGVYSGTNTPNLNVSPTFQAFDGYRFRCIVTGGCSPSVTSSEMTLNILQAPAINSQPSNQINCEGGAVSFSVSATGDGLTYQWQSAAGGGTNLSNGGAFSGVNSPTLTIDPVTNPLDGTQYRCVVTGTCTPPQNSNYATLNVAADPSISIQKDTSICFGGSMILTSSASGGTGSCNYQWQASPNGTTGWVNAGASSSVNTGPLTANRYYRCILNCSGSDCDIDTSNIVVVTVLPDPSISISAPATICEGGGVTLSASSGGGTGTCSYQWEQSPNGSTGWTATGLNSPTLNTGSLSADTWYRCTYSCTGNDCNATTSNVVKITVVPDPDIIASGSTTVCSGGNATLSSTVMFGTGSCSYQWQSSPASAGTWSNIGGSTSSFNAVNITASTDYRVIRICSGVGCDNDTSNTVTVTVVADPAISIAGGTTICRDNTTTLTATPANGTGSCSIQWQQAPTSTGPWVNVSGGSGGTTASYTTAPLTDTTYYRASYSCTGSGCDLDFSNVEAVNVTFPPAITAAPTGGDVCLNFNFTFNVSVSGTGPFSYQWKKDGTPIGGANAASYTVNSAQLTDAGSYYVVITNSCGMDSSVPVTLNVLTAGQRVVNNSSDAGPGSLRYEIDNSCPGDTIIFASATNGDTIDLANGDIDIVHQLWIFGNGPQNTIVSGNNFYNIFEVITADTVSFRELSVIDASSSFLPAVYLNFGINYAEFLKVHFRGNRITDFAPASALETNAAQSVFEYCEFSGNLGERALDVSGDSARIQNSTFYNNGTSTNLAGALRSELVDVTVINSTFNNNYSSSAGGALYHVNGGLLTVINSTIVGNTTTNIGGGGIYISGADLEISNTIVAQNTTTTGTGPDIFRQSGTVTSLGYNLIGNNDGSALIATTGDQFGTNIDPLDPRVDTLADNGGMTKTMALLCNSPAQDAGDPANPLMNDQRGLPRVDVPDIGAFEQQVPAIVVDAGQDTTICDEYSTVIGGMPTAQNGTPPFNYAWTPNYNIDDTTIANPTVDPDTTTSYIVTVTDQEGCVFTDSVMITVVPTVEAAFDMNPPNGCAVPHTVFFTNQSANADSVYWSFGDGNSSNAVNPIHTYTAVGTYNVQLFAFNTAGNCMDVTSQVVQVMIPDADFTATNTSGCGPLTVDFTDASAPNTASWSWDFGDGNTSTAQNPTHTYNTPGTYNVTLTVTAGNGCTDATTKAGYVVVDGPDVDFMGVSSGGCQPDTVAFTDMTTPTSAITGWSWDFGDGSPVSTVQNPTHIYTTAGSFDVSLTVTDVDGCSRTLTKPGFANIGVMPNASAGSDKAICLGQQSATLNATGGVAYAWSTGANTASITVSPAITTDYSVTITGSNGCTKVDTATVTVNPVPTADAGADDFICPGETGTLTATGGIGYQWSNGQFGATLTATPSTTTTYMVTVTDANGCTATDQAAINVYPAVVADAGVNDTICEGETGTLTASGGTNYAWSNGGGSATINVAPTATTAYTVTVTDANGCTDTDTAYIVVEPLPNASAGADDAICIGNTGTLTASGGVSYQWSNGASGATLTDNPTVTTTYTVTVTGANGCTASDAAAIVVNSLPNADVPVNDTICNGEFGAITATGGTSYQWSNGATGATLTDNPAVTTTYTVTVTDANGCTATATGVIAVNPLPVADAGADDVICAGETGTLTATGGVSYVWDDGTTGATLTDSPASTTTYSVTVTDANGCSATDDAAIQVNQLPALSLSGYQQFFCTSDPAVPIAGVPAGGTLSGTALDTSNRVAPAALGQGTYNIKYVYTNGNGCTDSIDLPVTILETPAVQLSGLDSSYCLDTVPVPMTGQPAGGTFSGPGVVGSNFISFFAGVGEHDILYTYTAPNGCPATDTVTVRVDSIPEVSYSGLDMMYCVNDTPVTLIGQPSGGTFSGPGITGSSFDPAAAGAGGPYAVSYTYQDGNGCSSTYKDSVVVNGLSPVAFVGLTDMFCTNGAPVSLQGAPAGGVYSGAGVNGNTFYPDSAGTGATTLSYTYTNANGCSSTATANVEVNDPPAATLSGLDSTYCVDDPAVTVNGLPAGGSFSGPGMLNNVFSPLGATTGGPYTITYAYTDTNNCTGTATFELNVLNIPVAIVSGLPATICVDSDPIVIDLSPAGGELFGPGITDSLFDPAAAGVGQHNIVYEVSNGDCDAQFNAVVTVDACTGINSPQDMTVNIFPNPTSGNVFIEASVPLTALKVYDLAGKQLMNNTMTNSPTNAELNLSHLEAGMYLIQVETNKGIRRTRIILSQ